MKCRLLFKRCASLCSSLWRRVSHIALSRGISKALRNIGLCLLAVLALTSSPLFSSSASALSFSTNYSSAILNKSYAYWAGEGFTQFVQQGDGGYFPSKRSQLYRVDVFFSSNIQPNSIVSFTISVPANAVGNTWVGFSPYDQYSLLSKTSYATNGYINETYVMYTHSGQDSVALVNPHPDSYVGYFSEPGVKLLFSGVSVLVLANSTDYTNNLSALLEQLTNANTNLAIVSQGIQGVISGVGGVQSSVNSAANQAHQDSQAQIDAIDDQTQQQQDQYEQEKQEESQREDDLNTSNSEIVGLFNFNFINPLASLYGLFSSGSSCASIPIISSLIGSTETSVCPWFSPTVRNYLTPVFGIASVMILFAFIVRWSLRIKESA